MRKLALIIGILMVITGLVLVAVRVNTGTPLLLGGVGLVLVAVVDAVDISPSNRE